MRAFSVAHSADEVKEAQGLLARIDLASLYQWGACAGQCGVAELSRRYSAANDSERTKASAALRAIRRAVRQ